jgi:IS30 family transposase
MSYTHLTERERYVLGHQHMAGWSFSKMSQWSGRSKGTLSREVRRNQHEYYECYDSYSAGGIASRRRSESRGPVKMNYAPLAEYVKRGLGLQWSPQQISERLKLDYPQDTRMRISHPCIYQWIRRDRESGGIYYKDLRQSSRKRRKRYGSSLKTGQIKDRVGIEQRPVEVNLKQRVGDWESDTIVGTYTRGPKLATHVERKTRYVKIARLNDGRARSFNKGTRRVLAKICTAARLTMTTTRLSSSKSDNGKEFALFKELEKGLSLKVYFAHPYTSWERGLNENTNGLIRQYFPKRTDFAKVSHHAVAKVEWKLNNRPRKCLGYRTPEEVLAMSLSCPAGVALQI